MNMLWIYDLSTPVFGVLCCAAFFILGIVGYFVTRPLVKWLMGPPPGHNEGVDVIIGAVTLLYGLILALIAVAAWEQFAAADNTVGQEAATLRSLYRDVDSYPEPDRTTLTGELQDYTKFVIDVAWPQQQRGIIPTGGTDRISVFEKSLYGFEPKTERARLVDESAIAEFNKMIELRANRLHAVNAGISGSLWAIILIGALITILLTYFLQLERVRAQLTMTSFVTVLIGIVIFMTAAVDHPFRGEVSVGSDAFQQTLELMTSHTTPPR